MKRAVIVHCWEGTPDHCWYPWAKKELEALGFEVRVPAMPDTENPKEHAWVPTLATTIGEPDEKLVLIGHSVGCITILRYLESLKEGQKVGKVVLVAPYIGDLGYEELTNFFEKPVNWEKIKTHCADFTAIHSDDDPYVPMEQATVFRVKLGAKIVEKHAAGHMSGSIENENACLELPEVVEAVEN